MKRIKLFTVFFLLLTSYMCLAQLPKGFVYANKVIPSLKMELRYCGEHNFVGYPIDGYHEEVIILTKQATAALQNVQDDLEHKGLGLKVFDAYRPQRAVNEFVEWAKRINDTINKQEFYPNVDKRHLFKEGYIAYKSGHSGGSTLDVTIIDLKTGEELDMGTPFDHFGKESWVSYDKITESQKANRQLLQDVMLSNGFKNYAQEWWHFTLKNQPFKGRYFDFPVE